MIALCPLTLRRLSHKEKAKVSRDLVLAGGIKENVSYIRGNPVCSRLRRQNNTTIGICRIWYLWNTAAQAAQL